MKWTEVTEESIETHFSVSNQTMIGLLLILLGLMMSIFTYWFIIQRPINNMWFITGIIGFIVFTIGIKILLARLDKWYSEFKPKYNKWLRK